MRGPPDYRRSIRLIRSRSRSDSYPMHQKSPRTQHSSPANIVAYACNIRVKPPSRPLHAASSPAMQSHPAVGAWHSHSVEPCNWLVGPANMNSSDIFRQQESSFDAARSAPDDHEYGGRDQLGGSQILASLLATATV